MYYMNHYPLIPEDEVSTLFSRGRAVDILQEVNDGKEQTWLKKESHTVNLPVHRLTTLPGTPVKEDMSLPTDYDYSGHPIMINGTPHAIVSTGKPRTTIFTRTIPYLKIIIPTLLSIAFLYQYIPAVTTFITPIILIYSIGFMLLVKVKEKGISRDSIIPVTVTPVWGLYREDHRVVIENSPWDIPRFNKLTQRITIEGELSNLKEITDIITQAETRWRRSLHHPEDNNQ